MKPGTTAAENAELREAKKRIRLLEQENEVLRRAAACLSQVNLGNMMYPLVRELAAPDARIRVPVAVTCRVLKIARQPYYRWLAQPVTDGELEQAYRADALFDAHRDDPEFGYRFLLDEARDAGQAMAERTVWRICSANGWWSAFGKPNRGKAGKPGPPVHEDLCAVVDDKGRVRHEFTAQAPNQLWLSDITEHRTGQGKLYLCAIKDVYSNRIVGYSIDSRVKSRLAVAALNNAVARRGEVAGWVVHTDRGPLEPALGPGVGVLEQAGEVGDTLLAAGPDGVLEGVQDQVGGHPRGGTPAHDPAGEDVEVERDVEGAGPGRDVGEVGHPELVGGAAGPELRVHQVGRPWCGGSPRVVRTFLSRSAPTQPCSR